MSHVALRLREMLDEAGVDYDIIEHRRDYTAQETAESTHTPGREFAKTVVVAVDGEFALAVIPAPSRVGIDEMREVLGADELRLATEEEIFEIFSDCELGAEPPFGNLYGIKVYVSPVIAEDDEITFNAGTHEDAIRMKYRDYERLVRPDVIPVTF